MRAKIVNEVMRFQREKNPKLALGLDPFEYDIEWRGDVTEENSDEIQKAKEWRFNGVGIVKITGIVDDEEIYFDINLSDGDYIRFDAKIDNDYAQISVESEIISRKNVLEEWWKYFHDEVGYIILAVMKVYEDIKLKKIQESFRKGRDPKNVLGLGITTLIYEIIKEVEENSDEIDWDYLNHNEETGEVAFRYHFQEYPDDLSKDRWSYVEVREFFEIEYQAIINFKEKSIKSVLTAENADIDNFKFKDTREDLIQKLNSKDIFKQMEKIYEEMWKIDKEDIPYEAYDIADYNKHKSSGDDDYEEEYDPDDERNQR